MPYKTYARTRARSRLSLFATGALLVTALVAITTAMPAMNTPEPDPSAHPDAGKPRLFYVYDPLCGWCYGFSPVMQKVHQNYRDKFEFHVISGGMYTGDRVGPIGQVAPYIRTGYRQVEQATGVKFGPKFLELFNKGTARFNSVPGCKAMSAFKRQKPDMAIEYAHGIQKSLYFDGKEFEDVDNFANVAARMGADKARFLSDMKSQAVEDSTNADFYLSERFGVQGFPAVLVLKNGKLYSVAEGYAPYEEVAKKLDKALLK